MPNLDQEEENFKKKGKALMATRSDPDEWKSGSQSAEVEEEVVNLCLMVLSKITFELDDDMSKDKMFAGMKKLLKALKKADTKINKFDNEIKALKNEKEALSHTNMLLIDENDILKNNNCQA